MLLEVLRDLDALIQGENEKRLRDGGRLIPYVEVKVLGQNALFEAKVNLNLVATKDLDAIVTQDAWVLRELELLLEARGLVLDPDAKFIWMPEETEYKKIYEGSRVVGMLADSDSILVSKAKKAPERNRSLIVEYLATGASERFFELAKKYEVNLEGFVK